MKKLLIVALGLFSLNTLSNADDSAKNVSSLHYQVTYIKALKNLYERKIDAIHLTHYPSSLLADFFKNTFFKHRGTLPFLYQYIQAIDYQPTNAIVISGPKLLVQIMYNFISCHVDVDQNNPESFFHAYKPCTIHAKALQAKIDQMEQDLSLDSYFQFDEQDKEMYTVFLLGFKSIPFFTYVPDELYTDVTINFIPDTTDVLYIITPTKYWGHVEKLLQELDS